MCVVGSLNMDLVVHAPRFPAPGETVLGENFAVFPGGKGANQAVAAARMGAQVAMIGCVGDDANGRTLKETLAAEGIDVSAVHVTPGVATGVAIITVSAGGKNTIVVAPGANAQLSPHQVHAAREMVQKSDVMLMQMEVPLASVTTAAQIARSVPGAGPTVILNAAPASPLPDSLAGRVDVLVVNETEAAIVGETPIPTIIKTLGERGVRYTSPNGEGQIPAFRVVPVDTVGAGDAFVGAMAATWERGKAGSLPSLEGLRVSLRYAAAAGALATTRRGAIPSLPTRQEVDALIVRAPS